LCTTKKSTSSVCTGGTIHGASCGVVASTKVCTTTVTPPAICTLSPSYGGGGGGGGAAPTACGAVATCTSVAPAAASSLSSFWLLGVIAATGALFMYLGDGSKAAA